jgi:hypothetical protein
MDEKANPIYDEAMAKRTTEWVEANGETYAAVEPNNENIAVVIGFQIDDDGTVHAHALRADRVATLNADSSITLPLAVAERFALGAVTWHQTSDTTWTLARPEPSVQDLESLEPAQHRELPNATTALDDQAHALVERLRRHQ